LSLLSVSGLGIGFGGIRAVDDVSFDVEEGQIVSIIGPNGAGKTTLFNIISGLYMPDAGTVMLGDGDVTGMRPDRLAARGLSRTFQNLQIFSQMTVLENVMTGCHLRHRGPIVADLLRLPSSRAHDRASTAVARELLDRIGLADKANLVAGSLSYGQLKRLEIARALATEPRLILLDEPAAGCNRVETAEIDELIARLAADRIAVLLVEHDMKLVMNISNRVVVLDRGMKIADGTPSEVARNPDVIAAYLGKTSDDGETVEP
jgi:branched-chain amino acid transport system ATP-binding protein